MKWEPHAFTLRQLQYVIAVADTLSFRRAAEKCHVSQPSLSAQIAQVEDLLGVQLFERDRRHVLPTVVGREVVERARRLVVMADDLVELTARARDPMSGTIRIGVIPTVSPYLLPTVTPALRATYPKLGVAWLEEKTEVLMRALDRGEIEAALLALPADVRDVEREIIAEDPFVLLTPPDHELAKKSTPAALGDLRDVEVLLLDDGHCFRDQALEVCGTARAREAEFRATSLSTLVQMVAGGSAITLLPAIAVAMETRRADVKVRSFVKSPHRTLALVWRKRSPYAASLRAIAEVVRSAYPHDVAAQSRSNGKRRRAD